jgi:hypothetical protein
MVLSIAQKRPVDFSQTGVPGTVCLLAIKCANFLAHKAPAGIKNKIQSLSARPPFRSTSAAGVVP